MMMKFKKAAVAAALVLAATVGFAAPALADGGSFNACLPAWQMPATVRNGYHSGGSSASVQVYSSSSYGGNFWIELPGQGQCASSVTVNAGKTAYPLLQLLQWLRDFDGASGWLGPKLLRPRHWVRELQLTTSF